MRGLSSFSATLPIPPLKKGGQGGFARNRHATLEESSKGGCGRSRRHSYRLGDRTQIPLNAPFPKGEAGQVENKRIGRRFAMRTGIASLLFLLLTTSTAQ